MDELPASAADEAMPLADPLQRLTVPMHKSDEPADSSTSAQPSTVTARTGIKRRGRPKSTASAGSGTKRFRGGSSKGKVASAALDLSTKPQGSAEAQTGSDLKSDTAELQEDSIPVISSIGTNHDIPTSLDISTDATVLPSQSSVAWPEVHSFKTCTHFEDSVDIKILGKTALRHPSKWKCAECETREDLWACCGCGHIGCGRGVARHALQHYNECLPKKPRKNTSASNNTHKFAHAISFNIRDGSAYCYTCDDWVVASGPENKMEQIQIRLWLITKGIIPTDKVVAHVMENAEARIKAAGRLVGTRTQGLDALQAVVEELAKHRATTDALHTVPGFSTKDAMAQMEEDYEASAVMMDKRRLLKRAFLPWAQAARESKARSADTTAPESHDIAIKTEQHDADAVAAGVEEGKAAPVGRGGPKAAALRRLALIPGRTGMRNMGNSCYIASTIQALAHTSAFQTFFREFQFFEYPADVTLTPLSPLGLPTRRLPASPSAHQPQHSAQHVSAIDYGKYEASNGRSSSGLLTIFSPNVVQAHGELPRTPLMTAATSPLQPTPPDLPLSQAYALPPSLKLVRQSTCSVYDAMTNARKDGKVVVHGAPVSSEAVPEADLAMSPEVPTPMALEPPLATDPAVPIAATNSKPKAKGGRRGSASGAGKPKRTSQRAPKRTEGNPWADSLVMQTSGAVKLLFSGRWSVFTPAGLIYAVWRNFPQFQSFAQQDAQELYNAFLDSLHEELKRGGIPKGLPMASSYHIPADAPAIPMPALDLGLRPGTPSRQGSGSVHTLSGTTPAAASLGSAPRKTSILGMLGSSPASMLPPDPTSPQGDSVRTSIAFPTAVRVLGGSAASVGEQATTPSKPVHPSAHSLPRFPQSTLIGDKFQGSTITRVTCDTCGNCSERTEAFWCLSLDIDTASPSLWNCFAKMSATESLTGDSAYFCETCANKQPASKTTLLHKVPDVFTVHLNRAQWTEKGRTEKVQTAVSFPLFFCMNNMHSFMSDEAKLAYLGADGSSSGSWYRLQAVVIHQGRGIQTGHYTAYCYDAVYNTWLWYDDHRVSPALWGQVQRAQAYLLVYEAVDPHDISPEARIHQGVDEAEFQRALAAYEAAANGHTSNSEVQEK